MKKIEIKWFDTPELHDYDASFDYMRLIFDEKTCNKIIEDLKNAPMTSFKAKDIFRASGLSLADASNFHVKKNLKKMKNGEKMVPILLVRDSKHGKVHISDGFHRLSAVWTLSEDINIPCKIITL